MERLLFKKKIFEIEFAMIRKIADWDCITPIYNNFYPNLQQSFQNVYYKRIFMEWEIHSFPNAFIFHLSNSNTPPCHFPMPIAFTYSCSWFRLSNCDTKLFRNVWNGCRLSKILWSLLSHTWGNEFTMVSALFTESFAMHT